MFDINLSRRLDIAFAGYVALMFIFAAVVMFLIKDIQKTVHEAGTQQIPQSIYSLSMLEEINDINANVLEYILGEAEEEEEFSSNFEEFLRYRNLLADTGADTPELRRVDRLMEEYAIQAKAQVFGTYDPRAEINTQKK
ncbi:hypothetical protein [uncultured Kiloniella sp.]|uniref:hypothetical protein n=1 Tax=uncultured Kiloniella sp. TaxID=1133091 RepID=UPI002611A6C6|nr:hypothetical protein [uncultured Kiloniella sp.]